MAYSETRSLLRPNIPMNSKKPYDFRRSSSSDDWSSSYSNSSGSQHSRYLQHLHNFPIEFKCIAQNF